MGIYFHRSRFLIFINSGVFSSKCVYLDALSFSSLFKIFAFFSSCVKAVNFASTTSPTSLFLFPVTVAVRRLSAFACKKKVKQRDSSIGTWPARVIIISVWSFMCHVHADCVSVAFFGFGPFRGSGWEVGGGTNVSCQLKFRPFVSCQLNFRFFVSCQLNGY